MHVGTGDKLVVLARNTDDLDVTGGEEQRPHPSRTIRSSSARTTLMLTSVAMRSLY
jgi:hypothetical protein